MSPGNAHVDSLPLFAYLQMFEGMGVSEASLKIRKAIEALDLLPHVDVVILIKTESGAVKSVIDIEALSSYGSQVLGEMEARSEFLPCPEGECEYSNENVCKWCGNLRSQ